MIRKRLDLWKPEEYEYPGAVDFIPNLIIYLHEETEEKRPCMLVIPGGGYRMVSPTEGEIVAMKFYSKGYQAFVCTYTTNMIEAQPLGCRPLQDISRAVRLIRKNADQLGVDEGKITICGFSAGAHLCGSLAVHYEDVEDTEEYKDVSNRPDSVILSYPVITAGEKAHRDSFTALLGKKPSPEELQYMSLETQVTEETPPCFLWQTASDELVPVENSYLFAESCRKAGVCYEHHVFSRGAHGLSLSDEQWARRAYGEPYTMEQNEKLFRAYLEGRIQIPDERVPFLTGTVLDNREDAAGKLGRRENIPEVAVWPELADAWLKTLK